MKILGFTLNEIKRFMSELSEPAPEKIIDLVHARIKHTKHQVQKAKKNIKTRTDMRNHR